MNKVSELFTVCVTIFIVAMTCRRGFSFMYDQPNMSATLQLIKFRRMNSYQNDLEL